MHPPSDRASIAGHLLAIHHRQAERGGHRLSAGLIGNVAPMAGLTIAQLKAAAPIIEDDLRQRVERAVIHLAGTALRLRCGPDEQGLALTAFHHEAGAMRRAETLNAAMVRTGLSHEDIAAAISTHIAAGAARAQHQQQRAD